MLAAMFRKQGKMIVGLLAAGALVTATVLGIAFYFSTSSIHDLLTENHKLNKAIGNLTKEESIGYAVVEEQRRDETGQRQTVVRFVQTAAGNPKEIVSEQLFTLPGDIVHFDALIVKFTDEYVRDGKERALYLWRRIYSEQMAPGQGKPIEPAGGAPERYYSISKTLRMKNREVFWEAIWSLANDPGRLSQYGVTAVFGNVNYIRMRPGRVYRFKIDGTGQIYPEVTVRP